MATQVQLRRGTAAQNDAFTGAVGEVTVDTDNDTLRVHDGGTAGGYELAKSDSQSHTNIDINSGTIDGVTIGGASAGAITGTTITGTSFVSSGNMSFGDNDKAIFGAGSDLQIYHDGSHSRIDDAGTGLLILRGNTGVKISQYNNNEAMATFNVNGSVDLNYDNATKLSTTATGIDVTGTVVSDGVDIVNDDRANGAVLNLTNSANSSSWVSGDALGTIKFVTTDGSIAAYPTRAEISVEGIGNSTYVAYPEMIFRTANDAANPANRMKISSNGDISFYEDTGTTPKFFWDASAERLGIGTSSPSALLHVEGSSSSEIQGIVKNIEPATDTTLSLKSTGSSYSYAGVGSNTAWFYGYPNVALGTDAAGLVSFVNNGSERMRIDSSGNVGIGNASIPYITPNRTVLNINGATDSLFAMQRGGGNNFYIHNNATQTGFINTSALPLTFGTSSAERARIDASGNLLVGKTTSIGGVAGVELRSDGQIVSYRNGNRCLYLDRLTSDGDIVSFSKDGSSVGSIGCNGDRFYFVGASSGVYIDQSDNAIVPSNTTGGNAPDNTVDLGKSGIGFKNLYLSGGVYLGGTGAANYLDDYEEGTWTATAVSGLTGFTIKGCEYVKVGNLVSITVYFDSLTGKSSNDLIIGGLPFAVKSPLYFTGYFDTTSLGKMGMLRTVISSTTFNAYYPDTSTGVRTNFLGSDMGTHFIGSFFYYTN